MNTLTHVRVVLGSGWWLTTAVFGCSLPTAVIEDRHDAEAARAPNHDRPSADPSLPVASVGVLAPPRAESAVSSDTPGNAQTGAAGGSSSPAPVAGVDAGGESNGTQPGPAVIEPTSPEPEGDGPLPGAPDAGVEPPQSALVRVFRHYDLPRRASSLRVDPSSGLLSGEPNFEPFSPQSGATERGGRVEIAADGSFEFFPLGGISFWGDDHFEYRHGATQGRVRITVQPSVLLDLDLAQGRGNGFVLTGAVPGGYVGAAVSGLGDFNGDGVPDVAPLAARGGVAHVVFGKSDSATLALANREPSQGFDILGVESRYSAPSTGRSALRGAGDVNGDGLADLLLGAPSGLDDGSARVYIAFGHATSSTLSLANLASSGDGAEITGDYNAFWGVDVAVSGAGDFNGDGLGDLIVGTTGDERDETSDVVAHVIFGQRPLRERSLYGLETAGQGVSLSTAEPGYFTGHQVSGAGDVNGDGLDDVIIGSQLSNQAYVVFGNRSGKSTRLEDLANGGGFAIVGTLPNENVGYAVSGAGDVNGDGRDDLIVGALGIAGLGRADSTGSAYVVFGKTDSTAVAVAELAPSQGFAIAAARRGDQLGTVVSAAGDFNGDGYADVLVGAPRAANGEAGYAYLIFGAAVARSVSLAHLEAGQGGGVAFAGSTPGAWFGQSLSLAGDLNQDGLSDVIVGAPKANGEMGAAYVFFGWDASDALGDRDAALVWRPDQSFFEFTGAPVVSTAGGPALDTLRVTGDGTTLDLDRLTPRFSSIETIDLSAVGAQTLRLSDAAVRRLPQGRSDPALGLAKTLVVLGDASDRVRLPAGYVSTGALGGRDLYQPSDRTVYYGVALARELGIEGP